MSLSLITLLAPPRFSLVILYPSFVDKNSTATPPPPPLRFLEPVDLTALNHPIDEILFLNSDDEVCLYENIPEPPPGKGLNVRMQVTLIYSEAKRGSIEESQLKELEQSVPGFRHVSYNKTSGRQVYEYSPQR